ncbi:family 2 glycosyl transferase [Photobacterium sp. GB-50]|uniref:glycosyltransferase family 2 protein n=1 Tax=Photobacterium sp. GB-50 TaxID=2022107 RepID=UPI000D162C71|nr:glycosyltransferase family 2 protein [Photobacterium sp. GB-50]PSW72921.1 family 2 glycosyl transferase [Photobacterium sp. GB-50]
MKTSLVITTYNSKLYLKAVLNSVCMQNILPDEVVIADDGSSDGTAEMLSSLKDTFPVPLIHAYQEDEGFRASRARNLAVKAASGDFIVMIDGDMFLTQNFIQSHINNAKKGTLTQGPRVKMRKELSLRVMNGYEFPNLLSWGIKGLRYRKNAINSSFLTKALISIRNDIKNIRSCNFAFWKQDYIAINGFDNDFIGWGREDSDFAQRLVNNGIKIQHIRCGCIGYHLWHEGNSQDNLGVNHELLLDTIKNKKIRCDNGIDQL